MQLYSDRYFGRYGNAMAVDICYDDKDGFSKVFVKYEHEVSAALAIKVPYQF